MLLPMSYYSCHNYHVSDDVTCYYSSSYPGNAISFLIIIAGFFSKCFGPKSPHLWRSKLATFAVSVRVEVNGFQWHVRWCFVCCFAAGFVDQAVVEGLETPHVRLHQVLGNQGGGHFAV
jgi:hypothetical protein